AGEAAVLIGWRWYGTCSAFAWRHDSATVSWARWRQGGRRVKNGWCCAGRVGKISHSPNGCHGGRGFAEVRDVRLSLEPVGGQEESATVFMNRSRSEFTAPAPIGGQRSSAHGAYSLT